MTSEDEVEEELEIADFLDFESCPRIAKIVKRIALVRNYMRRTGFEPAKTLSQQLSPHSLVASLCLRLPPLAAWVPPRVVKNGEYDCF